VRENGPESDLLDCLIVGGGPAGLTAALYLARFNRPFLAVNGGKSRASSIPTSHNIPVFAEGVSGTEILTRQRAHAERYGASVQDGLVTALRNGPDFFTAVVETKDSDTRQVRARHVLLATGAVDIEPDLPDLPNAVQRGLVRYCPICDGYEASDKKIAVIGYGDRGLSEAIFVARTYSQDVTLLTLGQRMDLDTEEQRRIEKLGIKVIHEPIAALDIQGSRISAIRTGSGQEHRFEVLYSALGLKPRSDLAVALGARHDHTGALIVDNHNRTTVKRLSAAGGVVRGLDQIVVAMGHAAIAATDIHNRCAEEGAGPGASRATAQS
jgi:thioredoxin reductase (NADPH)